MLRRSTAGESSVKRAALFAYAAGATGILANLFLIALYVLLRLQAGRPEGQTLLGSASDLAGSASDVLGTLSPAFMIPVALALAGRLPQRRAARFTQAAGLTAMMLLSVGGLLQALGVLTFEVGTLIAVAALMVLCLWLFLVNRWLLHSGGLAPRVARLGEFVGAAVPAGGAVAGLGLLLPWMLPWMSWAQLVVFGVGVVLGAVGWLGISIWFVLLGRHLAAS